MRIAYIGAKGLPSKGGAERVVEAIVHQLKDRHELTVYCNKDYTASGFSIPRVHLVRVPCFQERHLRPLSLVINSSLHALFTGHFDLIHLHNAEAAFVLPLLKLRFPVLATSHGPAYERDKWNLAAKALIKLMDRLFLSLSDRVTSVSLPVALDYKNRFNMPVGYIPNGVDRETPVDIEAGKELLTRYGVNGEYILFSAGRMDKTKGCHLLIEAFKKISEEHCLVAIGDATTDPEYGKALRASADYRVHFIPFISRKEVLFGILSNAKVFVFPSTVEAMSMALLEAASFGVPTLCSDIPANKAVLPKDALFFRSGDAADLKRKLCWALDHAKEMAEMGSRAQETVREKFSWDGIAKKYDELYRSLAAEKK